MNNDPDEEYFIIMGMDKKAGILSWLRSRSDVWAWNGGKVEVASLEEI